nr:MAG TPA: hypothetical protein [Caudoviricetes sp.]
MIIGTVRGDLISIFKSGAGWYLLAPMEVVLTTSTMLASTMKRNSKRNSTLQTV